MRTLKQATREIATRYRCTTLCKHNIKPEEIDKAIYGDFISYRHHYIKHWGFETEQQLNQFLFEHPEGRIWPV